MKYLLLFSLQALFLLSGAAHGQDITSWQFTKSLPLGFKPWGHRLVENQIHRFEVRPGDCSRARASNGWNDCANDRERHELKEVGALQREGDGYRYSWRTKVAGDWTRLWPVKIHLGQFHQQDGKPAFMFTEYPDGLNITNHLNGERKLVIPSSDMKGWNRFDVKAVWSKGQGGFFSVTVNDRELYTYCGPTQTEEAVYFKFGIYRAFVSRNPRSAHQNSVAYFSSPLRQRLSN